MSNVTMVSFVIEVKIDYTPYAEEETITELTNNIQDLVNLGVDNGMITQNSEIEIGGVDITRHKIISIVP